MVNKYDIVDEVFLITYNRSTICDITILWPYIAIYGHYGEWKVKKNMAIYMGGETSPIVWPYHIDGL